MSHKHLTGDKRDLIAQYHAKRWSTRRIANAIGYHHSCVARELVRNGTSNGYHAYNAQQKASERKRGRPASKMADHVTATVVKEGLKKDHSPEAISGRLGILSDAPTIGRQTIYSWIKEEQKTGRKWHRCLPRRGRPYRKSRSGAKRQRKGKNIAERPADCEARETIGHWEGDTLEGRKGGDAVVSLVERASRYTALCRVPDRSAKALEDAIRIKFAWQRGFPRRTLTVDRGGEFSDGTNLSKAFKAEVYFTDPYSPWQKGSIEQTNGLLRRYLPKGFDRINDGNITFAEDRLNHRPRKCLGYLTPHEVLFGISPS